MMKYFDFWPLHDRLIYIFNEFYYLIILNLKNEIKLVEKLNHIIYFFHNSQPIRMLLNLQISRNLFFNTSYQLTKMKLQLSSQSFQMMILKSQIFRENQEQLARPFLISHSTFCIILNLSSGQLDMKLLEMKC